MKRREAIKIILQSLNEKDAALFTTGMISREAFDIRDRKSNFYMLGSMGLVSSVGLGLAQNMRRKVFVFDGDGSTLMDMGAMAVVGAQRPSNLVHIVLDNESYQSTGAQRTMSSSGTAHTIARNRSGRCTSMAPISSPPLLPPMVPSRSGLVYPSAISFSPAAMKSSKQFWCFSFIPA